MPAAAVLFDLWGTLVANVAPAARDAVSRDMAADLGVDPRAFAAAYRDSYRGRFTGTTGTLEETIALLARRCGAEPSGDCIARAARRRIELTRRLLVPEAETLAVLDELLARGLRLGLVSDSSVETPLLWPSTPLASRIEVAAFSCLLGVRKPDPAIYRHVLDALEVAPEQCLFVGDGGSGELTGAVALGMQAVRLKVAAEPPGVRYDDDTGFSGRHIPSLAVLLEDDWGFFTHP